MKKLFLLTLVCFSAFAQESQTNVVITLPADQVQALAGTNNVNAFVQAKAIEKLQEDQRRKSIQEANKIQSAYRKASPEVQAQVKTILNIP